MCWITSLGHAAPPWRSRGGLKTTERSTALKWMALPEKRVVRDVYCSLERAFRGSAMEARCGQKGACLGARVAGGSIECSEPLHGCSFLLAVRLIAPRLLGDIFSILLSQKNEMKNEVSLFCCCVSPFQTYRCEEWTWNFNLFCSLLDVYFFLVLQVHVLKRLDWMLRRNP